MIRTARATALAALLLATPLAAQDEAIDLFDPSISACSSAPDAAWYYQINSGSDERCQIEDIRSPLVSQVWGCASGDCSALAGASGDSIDAGSADTAKPATRSSSLPGTCAEGQLHQDTDSGGSELYICTATDTWAKLDIVSGTGSYVLDSKTSSTSVVNSTTETTMYSYTITGGTLDSNDRLRLTLWNEYFNDTGTTRGVRYRVKLGGSTVIDWSSPTTYYGASANARVSKIEVDLMMLGATNAQRVYLSHRMQTVSTSGTLTAGIGQEGDVSVNNLELDSDALAVDMTSSQTLAVSIELLQANANHSWECYAGTLEHLR